MPCARCSPSASCPCSWTPAAASSPPASAAPWPASPDTRASMGIVPGGVDEYIASYPEAVQAVLQRARAAVRRAAPDAEETISYGMPTFRLYPGHAVSIGAWKHHIGMYPIP